MGGVGWAMKARAGKKKVVLELGGNAACIVEDLPENGGLPYLIDRLIFGAYYQSGQSCISTQRLLVRRELYADVVAALQARVKTLVMGDPLDPNTFIGPVISESEAKRMESWIEEAVAGGAKLLVGGKR